MASISFPLHPTHIYSHIYTHSHIYTCAYTHTHVHTHPCLIGKGDFHNPSPGLPSHLASLYRLLSIFSPFSSSSSLPLSSQLKEVMLVLGSHSHICPLLPQSTWESAIRGSRTLITSAPHLPQTCKHSARFLPDCLT
jgi:hypothetical protein